MRLYRLVGTHGDSGYAEIHGDELLDVPGMWRPATRLEYVAHYLLKARFSYVDLVAIAATVGIVTMLNLDWWYYPPILFILAGIVVLLEKRFR